MISHAADNYSMSDFSCLGKAGKEEKVDEDKQEGIAELKCHVSPRW